MKPNTKLVNAAFDKLDQVFYASSTNYAARLLERCIAEEKQHRSFGWDFNANHPGAQGVRQCAKAFAVRRVAEYLMGGKFPCGADYLHIQTSCFIAAGIVDEFRDKVIEAWADFDLGQIANLDYLDFVQPNREVKAAA